MDGGEGVDIGTGEREGDQDDCKLHWADTSWSSTALRAEGKGFAADAAARVPPRTRNVVLLPCIFPARIDHRRPLHIFSFSGERATFEVTWLLNAFRRFTLRHPVEASFGYLLFHDADATMFTGTTETCRISFPIYDWQGRPSPWFHVISEFSGHP